MINRIKAYKKASASYNFSGYGIQHLYTVFKTNLHKNNTPIRVEFDSNSSLTYVEFDSDGLISRNSPCSGYADFGDYLDTNAGSNIYHKDIYDGFQTSIGSNVISSGSENYNKIADVSGNILTKNGFPYFSFEGGGGMLCTTSLSVLDSGNDYSIAVVVSHHTSNAVGGVINSSNTAADRFLILCDRRTDKRHTLINDGSNNFADLTAQLNSSNSRVMIATMDGSTKNFKSYLGATLQNSTTYSGTYTNDSFRIGSNLSGLTPLNGTIQAILISNETWDSTAVSEINTKLANIFGL